MLKDYSLKDQASGVCMYCGASADMDCYCDEFISHIRKTESCWIWEGQSFITHKISYGIFKKISNGKRMRVLAHHFSYEMHKEKIPKGRVIDHLCNNGLCVNPDHLKAVFNEENILRGNGAPAVNKRKIYCKNNHLLDDKNIRKRGKRRVCLICEKKYNKERPNRKR